MYGALVAGLLLLTWLISYRCFLATCLAFSIVIPDKNFLLAMGLGLPLGGGVTVHPLELCLFAAILAKLLVCLRNLKVRRPSWPEVLALLYVGCGLLALIRGLAINGFRLAAWDARPVPFFLILPLAVSYFRSVGSGIGMLRVVFFAYIAGNLVLVFTSIALANDWLPPDLRAALTNTLEFGKGTRVAVRNTQALTVLLPLGLFYRTEILQARVLTSFQWKAFILTGSLAVMVGMSRTQALLITVNILALSAMNLSRITRLGVLGFISLPVLIVFFISSGYLQTLVVDLGSRMTDLEYHGLSLEARMLSFQSAIDSFLLNPFLGIGYGSELPLLWIDQSIHSEWLFVDNTFATEFLKLGLLGGIPLLLLSLSPLWLMWRLIGLLAIRTQKRLIMGALATYPSLWFALTMTSAHFSRSRSMIILFCVFLALLVAEIEKRRGSHMPSTSQ